MRSDRWTDEEIERMSMTEVLQIGSCIRAAAGVMPVDIENDIPETQMLRTKRAFARGPHGT